MVKGTPETENSLPDKEAFAAMRRSNIEWRRRG
jgi:hypothetical protein